jgi:hypothetical protein
LFFPGEPPRPCAGHTATLIDDRMLVIGGKDENSESKDMFYLDLQTFQWTQLQVTPLFFPLLCSFFFYYY